MGGQIFKVRLKIITECKETVDEDEVKRWLEEYFESSDLGEVTITHVEESDDE